MKPPAFEYAAATSVDHALALLQAHGEDARLLAGGQSLMPALNFRLSAPTALIDLNTVAMLAGVSTDAQGNLVAGAMTRHRYFETSEAVGRGWPLLRRAMASLAHVAIRNRGTIGGSLCQADPAAEWPALCLVCDARMRVRSRAGRREMGAGAFSQGLLSTALEPGELLEQIVFPSWPAIRRWGFAKVARRRGDFAIAGVACLLDVDTDGACVTARIVAFGVADGPVLLTDAAGTLVGRAAGSDAIRLAAKLARGAVACRADLHASAEYRAELVEALTARALAQAVAARPSRENHA